MTLTEGKLAKWLKQVNKDCPEDKHWVIWHKANDCAFVCIIPPCHFKEIQQNASIHTCSEDSVSPFEFIRKLYKAKSIADKLAENPFRLTTVPVMGFKVADQILVALSAKEWVKWALEWEKKQ